MKMPNFKNTAVISLILSVVCLFQVSAEDTSKLTAPDGKPADMSKPVQVYILMGQSNMLGFGKISSLKDIAKEKYPYLVDGEGNWNERKDVRNVRVMCSGNGAMKVYNNEWMSMKGKAIGPEIGIGHHIGQVTDAPVLILKSCIGNRSLGWDLLPPESKSYEYEGKAQPGYGEVSAGVSKDQSPGKWYAGIQYDGDTASAKQVLAELGKYYPGATKYEVAGFFFWQGDKDFRNNAHAAKYEENLVNLIKALRKDFNAPNAKFVCATLGQTKKGSGGNTGKILEAQLAIGDHSKYPDFKGQTASVYSHPLSKGGSSSGHYSGNPETYMNIGEAMGAAMAKLLTAETKTKASAGESSASSGAALVQVNAAQKVKLSKLIQETLVDMSEKSELKPLRLNISKTKANIWLTEASSDGTLTFQIMNGAKQAKFKFEDLSSTDHAILSRLIAALRVKDPEAQAIAALSINSIGNKSLASTYFKNSSNKAVGKIVNLLQ